MAISFGCLSRNNLSLDEMDTAVELETSIDAFLRARYRLGGSVYIKGMNFRSKAVEDHIKRAYTDAGWDVRIETAAGTNILVIRGKP